MHTPNCPILVLAGLFVTGLAVAGQADDDWAPIPPDELALKDDPLNPGAPAIILYRETVINHRKGFESHHYRIKILSDRGAEYGNVELPYTKEVNNVHDIKARTVQPDGTVVPFRGRVVEKAVAKTRDVRVLMKIFTLPQVEVGSIVEYKYRRSLNRAVPRERVAPNEIWMIQDDLSLLRGRFTANPLPRRHFGLIARNFPEAMPRSCGRTAATC